MAFEYQNYASLGINLNRQKYGPLDISSVFKSTADLNYYITKGAFTENVSQYWLGVVPYPYEGQLVSLIENGAVKIFKLVADGDNFKTEEITAGANLELPEGLATEEYVNTEIDALEKKWIPKMFVCCTQEAYNNMLGSGDININTPYLIIN